MKGEEKHTFKDIKFTYMKKYILNLRTATGWMWFSVVLALIKTHKGHRR